MIELNDEQASKISGAGANPANFASGLAEKAFIAALIPVQEAVSYATAPFWSAVAEAYNPDSKDSGPNDSLLTSIVKKEQYLFSH